MTPANPTFWRDLARTLRTLRADTRRGLAVASVLGVVTGLLEAVSVGAVVPLIMVMTRPNFATDVPALLAFIPEPWLQDRQALVIVGTIFFIALFLIKLVLSMVVTFIQSDLRGRLSAELASRLFADYLRRPYAAHLHDNSADINTKLVHGVQAAATGLHGLSLLIVEGVALVAIGGLLLYVDAAAALITLAAIGVPAFAVQRLTRRRLRRIGTAAHGVHRQATESMMYGLSALKELKVLGREASLHASFADARRQLGRIMARHDVLQVTPRYVIELATIGCVLLVASVLAIQEQFAAIAPILGLYAAAAFRVLPGVNRVLLALQSIRYAEDGLHRVAEDLLESGAGAMLLPQRSQTPLGLNRELRVEGVRFSYGEAPVLRGVDLNIMAGECVGFVGPSGAGKSTLMDLILGVLEPAAGRISVDGVDIRGRTRDWQAGIGYVPQSVFLMDDSIRANVAMGVPPHEVDDEQVWRALRIAQLAAYVSALPEGLATRVGERGARMSGGERQRIGIARALYHEPSVLVLDEPTNSLDIPREQDLLQAVLALRGSKTILIVAHRTSALAGCDKILRLDHGRIAEVVATTPHVSRPPPLRARAE